MNAQATESTTVRRSITVEAPIERAFSVFTDGIGTWWNPDHHLIDGQVAEMVFEPRAGGHIIDRTTDGRESRWSRVLVYEPPTRVVFSWDIGLDWQLHDDYERSSEVEVSFTAQGPDSTLVELEHRNLDRHGDGWEGMRDAVNSGWELETYAAAVTAQAAPDPS